MMQALDFDRIVRVKVIFLTICHIFPEIIWNQSVFCLYLQRAFDKFEIRIENNKYKSIRRKKAKMADDLGSIHCLYAAKAVPMNGAPSFEC